jgi:hypothetical protein
VPSTASTPFGVREDVNPVVVDIAGSAAAKASFVDEAAASASAEVTHIVSDVGPAVVEVIAFVAAAALVAGFVDAKAA